jgi:hypothetical protein
MCETILCDLISVWLKVDTHIQKCIISHIKHTAFRILLNTIKPSTSHLPQQSINSFCIYVFRIILRINSDYFLKQPLTG